MSEDNIEVGYGFAEGADSYAVGLEAAPLATAGIAAKGFHNPDKSWLLPGKKNKQSED